MGWRERGERGWETYLKRNVGVGAELEEAGNRDWDMEPVGEGTLIGWEAWGGREIGTGSP